MKGNDMKNTLAEGEKPKIVKNLEDCFPGLLWDPDRQFNIGDNDVYLLFDAINDGIFSNRLDRGIPKFTLKVDNIKNGPRKYRGMENALAAFMVGCVKGIPRELIMVKYNVKMSFFTMVCSLIHEMIHMYDFHFGPMGKQLDKYGIVASYNFNYPFMDPRTGRPVFPRSKKELADVNRLNAMFSGFQSLKQLPNELLDKIDNPEKNDARPRQYQLPGVKAGTAKDPDTGITYPTPKPYPRKFTMDAVDGFYDVHGDFFMNIANTINSYGFCVTDVFSKSTSTRMTRTYESEGAAPKNAAETMFAFFKDDEHKGCDYQDEGNWFVEIT